MTPKEKEITQAINGKGEPTERVKLFGVPTYPIIGEGIESIEEMKEWQVNTEQCFSEPTMQTHR